jgi:hypothetical protein
MAGSLAAGTRNSLVGLFAGAVAYTPPTTLFIALSTANASSGVTEVTGTGYARASVTNNTTNWNTASSGVVTNKVAITFTATGPWSAGASILSFAIYDALTVGTLLGQGDLNASQVMNNGDTLTFAIGALSISLT